MSRYTWITVSILAGIIVLIVVALLLEAASGPSFRAEDHDSYRECVLNIPAEWGPGSLERSGAEEACMYVHGRAGPPPAR